MKRLFMAVLCMPLMVWAVYATVVSEPSKIDFGDVYQGREYKREFSVILKDEPEKMAEEFAVKEIVIKNAGLKVSESRKETETIPGVKHYSISFKPEKAPGTLDAKLEIAYELEGQAGSLIIPVNARISIYSIIYTDPPEIDFGDIYQGREYTREFAVVLKQDEGIIPEAFRIKEINSRNRDIKVLPLNRKTAQETGGSSYALTLIPGGILGKLADKLEVVYEYDGAELNLAIPVKAQVTSFYILSPPSIVIRDITRNTQKEYTICIETDDKSEFRITDSSFSGDGLLGISISDINSFRKKVSLVLLYKEEGRYFDTLSLKTDNPDFPDIMVECLANAAGYIISDKRDIPFGALGSDDGVQTRNLILKSSLGALEVEEITHTGNGLLEFEIRRLGDDSVSIGITLDPKRLERDFFGEISVRARAGDIVENLKITYHGRYRKKK